MPTSQGDAASTVRHEPSLIDMTISKPRSISTTVCLTRPRSSTRAAPWVRLARPEAIAACWSGSSRVEAVGPLARMQAADQVAGLRPLVAGQHTAELVGKHDQLPVLA